MCKSADKTEEPRIHGIHLSPVKKQSPIVMNCPPLPPMTHEPCEICKRLGAALHPPGTVCDSHKNTDITFDPITGEIENDIS